MKFGATQGGVAHGDRTLAVLTNPDTSSCALKLCDSVNLFANNALNCHEDGMDELQSAEQPPALSTMSSNPTQLGRYLGFLGKISDKEVGTS